jgi:hypothetical protein
MPAIPPHLIEELASDDEFARTLAAEEIHRIGRTPALRVVKAWQANPHLGALLPAPELNVVVGLAVQPVTFAAIRTAFGNPALATVPPDQDALEFELQFTSGVALDILTSREPGGEGAIARFLAKFGEAVQQVEFPCHHVDAAAEFLKTKFALAPLYPAKRPGANGSLINFFLATSDSPAGKEKILIELFESPASLEAPTNHN